MKPIVQKWLVLVTTSMGLCLVLADRGLAQNNQGQNDQGTRPGVPNGTYAFQDSGYVPAIPPATGLLPLQGAGQETFFANGTITGLVSFSVGGTVFSRVMLTGTFTVNGDGSVSETLTQIGGPRANAGFCCLPYAGRQYHDVR